MKNEISNLDLSVVLPAYNDELTISQVALSFIEVLRPRFSFFEIIIVEDGSGGITPLVCDDLASKNPVIKVIHHQSNLGYGTTLRDGFMAARGGLVFYTDGDRQYDCEDLLKMLDALDKCASGAVIGIRSRRQDGLSRWLVSKIYNLLFRSVFRIKVKDVNCSFKLVKKDILDSLYLKSKSAFIDAEMIFELKRNGHKVVEVPVKYFPNRYRQSHFVNPRLTIEMLYEMFKKRLGIL